MTGVTERCRLVVLVSRLSLVAVLGLAWPAIATAITKSKEFPVACFNREPGDSRYAAALVPGWRDRYLDMTVALERRTTGRSRPVRVASKTGLAGIDQVAKWPGRSFSVRIEGRVVAGAARVIIGYTENGKKKEEERALTLKSGHETLRFHLPSGERRVGVMVRPLTAPNANAALELDSIRLVAGRQRQFLRNPGLNAQPCPPLPPRPEPVNVLPVWLRLLATGFLLVLSALAIRAVAGAVAARA